MKIDFHAMTGREKAFTLVELLIVIAIIAILSVAFLPNVLNAPKKARDVVRVKAIADIAGALDVHFVEKGKLPATSAATGEVNCFNEALATATGLNINNAKDSKEQGSCVTTGTSDQKKYYFYKAEGSNYYVVAAKLETGSAANVYANSSGVIQTSGNDDLAVSCGTSITLAAVAANKKPCYISAKGIDPTSAYNIPWFIQVGPQ